MIGCIECHRAKTTWRCVACYMEISKKIIGHNKLLGRKNLSPLLTPAVERILRIDWDRLLHNQEEYCGTFELLCSSPLRMVWRGPCPSCDHVYIPRALQFRIEECEAVIPRVASTFVEVVSLTVKLSSLSWDLTPTLWRVKKVSVDKVLEDTVEDRLKHRFSVGTLRNKFGVFHGIPRKDNHAMHTATVIHTSDFPCTLISAMVESGQHTRNTRKQLRNCLEKSHVQKRCSLGATKLKNQKGGAVSNCIRVNRVGGVHGHVNDCRSDAVKLLVCNALCSGAIPRSPHAAVMVPYQNSEGLVTTAVPFYISTSKEFPDCVTPRHNAPPRLGSVCKGERLVKNVRSVDSDVLVYLFDFVSSRINSAYLLIALSRKHESISLKEAFQVVRVFHVVTALHNYKHYQTVKKHKRKFAIGEYVVHENEDGTLVEGLVEDVVCDYKYRLLHVSEKDGKRVIRDVHVESMIPLDTFLLCMQFCDADPIVEKFADMVQFVMKLMKNGYSLTECLVSFSNFTTSVEASGMHKDDYERKESRTRSSKQKSRRKVRKKKRTLMEGKAMIEDGNASPGLRLPESGSITKAPVGALCYPMYKVATVCTTECFEMHVLHGILHGGVVAKEREKFDGYTVGACRKRKRVEEQSAKKSIMQRRGCWSRGKFYENGIACLDWISNKSMD